MTRTLDLAVIAGDGIGPEVVAEGLKVLDAVLEGSDIGVHTTEYSLGADRWHATGETLTDADLESLAQHEAILLGDMIVVMSPRPASVQKIIPIARALGTSETDRSAMKRTMMCGCPK